MACQWIKLADGTRVHINFGRGGKKKKQQCRFCRRGWITKLCDFPVGHGKTCDAGMCDACATTTPSARIPGTRITPEATDYCPIHKGQTPEAAPPAPRVYKSEQEHIEDLLANGDIHP